MRQFALGISYLSIRFCIYYSRLCCYFTNETEIPQNRHSGLNTIWLNTGALASRNNPNGSDWRNVNNIYGSTSKLVAWIRIW